MNRGRIIAFATWPVLLALGLPAAGAPPGEAGAGRVGGTAADPSGSVALLLPRPGSRRPAAPPAEDAAPATTDAPAPATPATRPDEVAPATGGASAGASAATAAGMAAERREPVGPEDAPLPVDDLEGLGATRIGNNPPRPPSGAFGTGEFRNVGSDFLPLSDRWRIGLPPGYIQNTRGSILDPYGQNVLKGDYPLPGTDDLFLVTTLVSDTLLEARRLPTVASVAPLDPGHYRFFEQGDQQLVNQNFVVSFELFAGDTAYKPRDWELRFTGVANFNYTHAESRQVTDIDFRKGRDRLDDQFSVQELFYEQHILDVSTNYDVFTIRGGIQGFTSDFRGFLYSDNEPGIRILGTLDNNRLQYNLIYLRQLEKDTNSGLLEFNDRNQNVFIANVFRQDFIWPGYTASLSFHANWDRSSNQLQYDENGFLVRPAPVGTIREKEVDAYYLGWAGDGHIGRLNITHQFYQVFGRESSNPLSLGDGALDINAQFFAVELSYDQDYIRYRASFAYQSGDDSPLDGQARGFDGIFDNPNFAGGGISFYTRQRVPLTGSGVGLVQRNSFFNNLRTSKEQGQANFVNPGLLLYNVGMDVDVTQKLKLIGNASYLQFVNTEVLQEILQDDRIGRDIGIDLSLGVLYRPLLNNNVIINAGAAALVPGNGFKGLYSSETLYSFFIGVTLTY